MLQSMTAGAVFMPIIGNILLIPARVPNAANVMIPGK
jgi:hypothetical protein